MKREHTHTTHNVLDLYIERLKKKNKDRVKKNKDRVWKNPRIMWWNLRAGTKFY
jgi:hypothetical protein